MGRIGSLYFPMTPLVAVLPLLAGCMCYSAPSRVTPPDIAPASAAGAAIEQYDADGNGQIDGAELEQAGAFRRSMDRFDANGDQSVSHDEIESVLSEIVDGGTGLMTFSCQVTLDGRSLSGAKVEFTPEPFLDGAVVAASGETDANGMASIMANPTDLPEDQQTVTGVIQPGVYQVRITHPQGRIPAKYNTETTLGQLVAPGVGDSETITFELSSK